MAYLQRGIFLLLLACIQPSVLPMDHASSSPAVVSFEHLPPELSDQVFEWVNYDFERAILLSIEPEDRAGYMCSAIKKLIACTKVSKAIRIAVSRMINIYFLRITSELNLLGGYDEAFYLAVTHNRELMARLCRHFGANIDKIHADGDTALTYAIKHNDVYLFNMLLALGVDPMCPNKRNQVPIDLAYEAHSKLTIVLKDNGGDPENNYEYHGINQVYPKLGDRGSYRNYQQKKKTIVDVSINTIVQQQPVRVAQQSQMAGAIHSTDDDAHASGPRQKTYVQGFYRGLATGVFLCCIGYWFYSKCYGTDDEQEEHEQEGESGPIYS
jgi:hypothetical protein